MSYTTRRTGGVPGELLMVYLNALPPNISINAFGFSQLINKQIALEILDNADLWSLTILYLVEWYVDSCHVLSLKNPDGHLKNSNKFTFRSLQIICY